MAESDNADARERETVTVTVSANRISLVWLIPVVALLVGGWLAFKTYSEQGPQVAISFKTADGLEAGKTLVKYKDVVVGQVEDIHLSGDLSRVLVQARLDRDVEDYLTDKTRFWVVRARVTAGSVSGLGTLFSGAYIAMDPVPAGRRTNKFTGLEEPPIVTTDEAGRHFNLVAAGLGSINIGSPLYFRGVEVGSVVAYDLPLETQEVNIRVFVQAPYDQLVHENTRFWNASGVDFRLTAEGLVLDTQSLVAVLVGGIAFDTPNNLQSGGAVEEDHQFTLFANRTASAQPPPDNKTRYLLFFSGSVRGLAIGAPVEFHGIKIGEVLDLKLEYHTDLGDFLIPVLIEIESGRMTIVGPELDENASEAAVDELVAQGLRAQLKSGSLITGQLYVDLDFHPEAPEAEVDRSGRYPVVPTVPAPLEAITASVRNILDQIERLPLEEIGSDVRDAVRGIKRIVDSEALLQAIEALNETLHETQRFTAGLNRETAPALNTALRQSQRTLASADNLFSPDSALYRELKKLLHELSAAARSIRVMTDYLERHPDALIYGKGKRR